jgi:hypothetical protein
VSNTNPDHAFDRPCRNHYSLLLTTEEALGMDEFSATPIIKR